MKLLSIILLVSLVALASCKSKVNTPQVDVHTEFPVDSLPGECAYLTKDTKGHTVLSWARILPDSSTAFCYSFLKDEKSFSNTVVIPNTGNIQPHGENLPKIIFKPSGEIIALWGVDNANPKNKYSGLVSYVQSFDDGKTWTDPRPLTTDTASFDQRYYDVALLANGEAGIIWLDNRKATKLQGSGLFFASTEGENGFQNERLISQPCCQCCRTDLFVDSKGYIHALFRGIIQDSIRDMVHMVSVNGGKEFSDTKRISEDNWVINGCPHTGPAMAETRDGLQFAWYTGGKVKGCFYAISKNDGNSFSKRSSISEFGSHPQLASLGDDVIVAWDEATQKNNKHYKRIGIQRRSGMGIGSAKEFITSDTNMATYPVITAVGKDKAVVAYSLRKQAKNFIYYQILK